MRNFIVKTFIFFLFATTVAVASPNVELVMSTVSFKDSRSTGSSHANWKIHLKNNTQKPLRGQLWVYGYDKDGFQNYKNLYEVLTTLKPMEEKKVVEELFFEPGIFQQISTFKFELKGF